MIYSYGQYSRRCVLWNYSDHFNWHRILLITTFHVFSFGICPTIFRLSVAGVSSLLLKSCTQCKVWWLLFCRSVWPFTPVMESPRLWKIAIEELCCYGSVMTRQELGKAWMHVFFLTKLESLPKAASTCCICKTLCNMCFFVRNWDTPIHFPLVHGIFLRNWVCLCSIWRQMLGRAAAAVSWFFLSSSAVSHSGILMFFSCFTFLNLYAHLLGSK